MLIAMWEIRWCATECALGQIIPLARQAVSSGTDSPFHAPWSGLVCAGGAVWFCHEGPSFDRVRPSRVVGTIGAPTSTVASGCRPKGRSDLREDHFAIPVSRTFHPARRSVIRNNSSPMARNSPPTAMIEDTRTLVLAACIGLGACEQQMRANEISAALNSYVGSPVALLAR